MTGPSRHQITIITHTSHDPAGKVVEATIGSDLGGFTIVTTPEAMMKLSGKLSELAGHAMELRGRSEGRVTIEVARVSDVTAQAGIGVPVIVVALRRSNGIVLHFALTPKQSEFLRERLATAEPQARENLRRPT